MSTTNQLRVSPDAACSLTMAIDFDHTWTADPLGWLAWYDIMVARGHIVILATGRDGWSGDMGRAHLPDEMPIVYCGREMKEHATRKAGWSVNIWIDDMPGMIQDCRILGGDLSSANALRSNGEPQASK